MGCQQGNTTDHLQTTWTEINNEWDAVLGAKKLTTSPTQTLDLNREVVMTSVIAYLENIGSVIVVSV